MTCTHGADPGEDHGEAPAVGRRMVMVREAVLSKNDRLAAELRADFVRRGLGVFNLLSSPGSGKTTLLQQTLLRLQPETRAGVIVGDLATDNDARRLSETGAPVVQIETGGLCHLEADMVDRAARALGLDDLDLLFIENVGNLVCPAGYDLGEAVCVVLLSVTEGEDKPLKYPTAFQKAHAVVVSKIDMSEPAGFDRDAALANIRAIAPDARVFELSSRTGAGMDAWCAFVRSAGRTAANSPA
jgi:hydrogenase nickel incorporation protein HypB